MMSPNTLLLGGGYTLTRVASLLPKRSFVISSRSVKSVAEFQSRGWIAEQVKSDSIGSLSTVFEKFPSIDQVVDSIPPLHELGERVALLGVENLCKLLPASEVVRLVYLSTTGVFGVEDGSWVDESTSTKPNNPRAQMRLESEQMYRSYLPSMCAFRIAAIYGPGRGIGTSLKAGTYRKVHNLDRWSNRIHVEDVASAIKNALSVSIDKSLPPVVCLSDDRPSLISEIISYYCQEFSLPEPGSVEREEVEKRGAWTMLSNQRVSNALLRKTLLPDMAYPTYREGAKTEFMTHSL